MNRKDFLKGLGIAGVGVASIPVTGSLISKNEAKAAGGCVLIPSETAGPFPLDLTENTTFFRQDIRESQPGVQLNLRLKILGLDNCAPMENVRVNIWHCTNEGYYSGYDNQMNPGQAGLTYLRGYQYTDSNGEVEFITVFPGWYNGRICHIHFQVHVNSNYSAVSQLGFDTTTKNAIYAANPSLYPNGSDPMTWQSDNVFSDGHDDQLATLTVNTTTGGYDSYLEVTVQGTGVTTGYQELQNAKQFELGQNYPNPHSGQTTVPFTLQETSKVTLELWDMSGRKVSSLPQGTLSAGDHRVEVDLASNGLPTGTYVYQLQVENANGLYRDTKVMTASK